MADTFGKMSGIRMNDGAPSASPASSRRKASSKKQKKVIPPEGQQHMGRVLCKEANGVKYLGTVIDYNIHTKFFTIKYNEDESEDLEESEIRKMFSMNHHIQELLCGGSRRISVRTQQKRTCKRASVPRGKKRSPSTNNYVPLAFRNWRDDYYWY